jgi:hypothetical protein
VSFAAGGSQVVSVARRIVSLSGSKRCGDQERRERMERREKRGPYIPRL